MNTKQLQYIQTLAREGQFSRAAETLGISQPSLSQYIRKIETEVGQELFVRSGTEVRLTPAGEICLELGGRILELEQRMKEQLADLEENRTGVLTIGAAPFRASSLLPRAVAEFRKEYPGMTVRISERMTAELLAGAEHGDFDLCLCTPPPEESGLVSEFITAEKVVLAVPASYEINRRLESYGKVVPFTEVAGLPFVSVGEEQALGKLLFGVARMAGVTVNRSAVCINVDSCLAMAREGIGAALLPAHLVHKEPRLCCYDLADLTDLAEVGGGRPVVALYQRGAYVSRPMRDMIRILKSLYGGDC